MSDQYYKFPATPHLAILNNNSIREEKILSKNEIEIFTTNTVRIEEKIDGANLGISFDNNANIQLQNRGNYLIPPFTGQWKPLMQWLKRRESILFDILSDRYILYGEWCYVRHTVFYDKLPDWFLAFDVFDKRNDDFVNTKKRHNLLGISDIKEVPFIASGIFSYDELIAMTGISAFRNQQREGIYLRLEDEKKLLARAKIIRGNFIQSDDKHWSNRQFEFNKLNTDVEK